MIKREKKRKLRGSVLLTVVCVMSLLIVFLFGTLALATAANNRAHVNYSTAQTGVTSRTVVDAAVKAIDADPDYANAVSALKFGEGIPLNVKVDFSSVPDSGKYGKVSNVFINAVGKKKIYNEVSKTWDEGDIIQFKSTVSMAGVDSTTSAYVVKYTSGGDNGGGSAGFVTTDGDATFECQTNLYGGSYINLPKKEVAEKYNYEYRTDSNYMEWNKDNTPYDETLYRQFAPYGTAGDKTFKLGTAGGGATVEADLYVNNNMLIDKWEKFIFPDRSTGVTVWGDMVFGANAGHMHYESNVVNPYEANVLDETGKVIGTENKYINFNEVPYIYVDGKMYAGDGNGMYVGNTDNGSEGAFPLNVFCGSIETVDKNNFEFGADLYCMNPEATSRIICKKATSLYNWIDNVANRIEGVSSKEHNVNSIYSKGSMEISKLTITGDVRVEKDFTVTNLHKQEDSKTEIKGKLVDGNLVGGDLVVGGNLYITTATNFADDAEVLETLVPDGNIYCDHIYIDGKEVKNGENVIEYKVPNAKRKYLTYMARFNESFEIVGLFDEPLTDINVGEMVYYKWNDDKAPHSWEADWHRQEIIMNANSFFDSEKVNDAKQYYKQEDGWPKKADDLPAEIPGERAWDEYYVETIINPDPSDQNKKVTASKIDEDGVLKCDDINHFDWSYEVISTGSIYTEEKYTLGSITNTVNIENWKTKSEYGKTIYPEYAERDVILGLKTLKDSENNEIAKTETQIVKTMKEILEKVNPYKYEAMPEKFLEIQNAVPQKKFESTFEIIESNNKIALDINTDTGAYEEATYTGKAAHGGPCWKRKNGTEEDASNLGANRAAVITESCVLNLSTSSAGGDSIVIDPDGKEIYIVVENLSMADNGNIIINDSKPGSVVNFYINGTMNLSNTKLMTTTYLSKINEFKGAGNSMGYNSGCDLNLEDLGSPRVNIYGGSGSELNSSNTKIVTANIMSPYLKVTFSAESGENPFGTVKYNGSVIPSNQCKQLIIGCLNAKEVTMPNVMSVLYVKGSDDDDDNNNNKKGAFNYKILYYDEY